MKNYYEILEVDKNASQEVIEKAYRTLVKKYHPDLKSEIPKKEAESKIKQINEAYDILSNIEKRETYNRNLKNQYIEIEKYNLLVNENMKLKNELNNIQNYQKSYSYKNHTNNYTHTNSYSENTTKTNSNQDEYSYRKYNNITDPSYENTEKTYNINLFDIIISFIKRVLFLFSNFFIFLIILLIIFMLIKVPELYELFFNLDSKGGLIILLILLFILYNLNHNHP